MGADGKIPNCVMDTNVIFQIIEGKAKITVNDEENVLETGECLVTERATVSMETEEGARILGIQISS